MSKVSTELGRPIEPLAISEGNSVTTYIKEGSKGILEHTEQSVQSSTNESKTMTDPTEKYMGMTDAQKVASLEKAVADQGEYLKSLKSSMKTLNRRNTLAVIELQMLVRDCEIKHSDLREIINPVMAKVSKILDFKQPYEV